MKKILLTFVAVSFLIFLLHTNVGASFIGDTNNDGKVSGIDYVTWLNNFGTKTSEGVAKADFNLDQTVDNKDFLTFLANYDKAIPTHPNIVFILADDMRFDDLAYMPKLKHLLTDQGAFFSNYYISTSMCCPSRVTTLRGQYAHNSHVASNENQGPGGLGGFWAAHEWGDENSTIATWLKNSGYDTALFGKYLNGYPADLGDTYIPPGWTDWHSAIGGSPYDEYNYTLNNNGILKSYGNKNEDYGTDVYIAQVTAFITNSINNHKPFFAYVGLYPPHAPATPANRHLGLFSEVKAPRDPNFNEDDVSDKPVYIQKAPKLTDDKISTIDAYYQKRLQSLQAMDEGIESLYNKLSTSGQLDNTYFVFASDNGFHVGNHRIGLGKGTPYEEATHVPLIIRGPNINAGMVINNLTGNTDLASTFADMSHTQPDNFVDGRSLMPLLLGNQSLPWRNSYVLEIYYPPSKKGVTTASIQNTTNVVDQLSTEPNYVPSTETNGAPVPPIPELENVNLPYYEAIKTKDWVYVEYYSQTADKEFYDLKKDPYELNNLFSKLDTQTKTTLSSKLKQLQVCSMESCRTLENEPLTITIPQ